MAAIPVILSILKIIGIVLLCVIGFVLLILLLVMFVPIRYRARFARTGLDTDPPADVYACVSFLLHLVHISAVYRGEVKVTVRVFGIPVFTLPVDEDKKRISEAKKEAKKERKKAKEENTKEKEKDKDKEKAGEESVDDRVDQENISEDAGHNKAPDINEAYDTGDDTQDSAENDTESAHRSIFRRIRDLIHKIRCTLDDIYDKINDIVADTGTKLKDIKDNIHYYHTILTSELFERTFAKCKKKVLRLLKSILPRKGDIRLEAGFDDPYTTGEVLAIASMLYPITGKVLHVYGNFEEAVIRGAGYIRGRIYIFSFVKIGLYYLTDRDLKKLIRLFKKEPPKKRRTKHG